MKMKLTLNLITLIAALFIINYSVAQTSNRSSVAVPNGESWLPVNEFNPPAAKKQNGNTIEAVPPLNNVLEGVAFYTMKATCSKESVTFLKLINTNDYIVKVEWQLNPNDSITLINIPANTSFQGECSSDNDTVSKLIFKNNNESENLNEVNYLYKSVKVFIFN